ncbi:hypothetical protein AB670_01708 [Chryseobacterium sp. MOF25P]|uniref:hypothetical protein n=1 Tax=unclassified Chryseobacterium TaxID=2593645 RepID=UPI000805DC74|nr:MULTISPECIES: hypothetical protein [unclassified Chryseobacterium]OBW41893.1 hypothetical protein AB670_01708 [Chryseobacterium sp. MOF25P]OBW45100.1 hypothetical protein AB671_02829 [Chryseobacterium sp. BGARF1]
MATTKEKLLYLLYWIMIFTVSGSMISYGIGKPLQFENLANSTNVHLSEGHKIMWTFYSYTKTYPLIIGFFEIVGGVLLLFNRTRIFACLLLTTMLINIIIQDYFYQISALSSAIFYQILIIIILLFDYDKVKNIVQELFKNQKNQKNIILIILALILALVVKYLEARL